MTEFLRSLVASVWPDDVADGCHDSVDDPAELLALKEAYRSDYSDVAYASCALTPQRTVYYMVVERDAWSKCAGRFFVDRVQSVLFDHFPAALLAHAHFSSELRTAQFTRSFFGSLSVRHQAVRISNKLVPAVAAAAAAAASSSSSVPAAAAQIVNTSHTLLAIYLHDRPFEGIDSGLTKRTSNVALSDNGLLEVTYLPPPVVDGGGGANIEVRLRRPIDKTKDVWFEMPLAMVSERRVLAADATCLPFISVPDETILAALRKMSAGMHAPEVAERIRMN